MIDTFRSFNWCIELLKVLSYCIISVNFRKKLKRSESNV